MKVIKFVIMYFAVYPLIYLGFVARFIRFIGDWLNHLFVGTAINLQYFIIDKVEKWK